MDISSILDPLNPSQREAVCAEAQNLLVLAGAGSGKTRVLIHRMAWLMQAENQQAHNILAVTFTNKAAKEMRLRLEQLLALPSRKLWVGTFHGLAHRLLKLHWRDAGLREDFQILDSDDQLRLIKRLLKTRGLDDSRWQPRQVQWYINARKDEGQRAVHQQKTGDFYQDTLQSLYLDYEQACNEASLVDFGELLLRSHELWLNNPALLQHYQQRFHHILVDEFQDTNTIQYAWLRVLAGKSACVFAVGDDDQSIYGWRGARIENIQRFPRDFEPVSMVRLEQNYRSTGTILNAANHVIANNTGRLGKELWTDKGEGEPILLYTAFNEQDEARFIVERIKAWVEQGGQRAETAILYRSNAQSRILEETLLREGVPYRVYGGQRFYDRMEIRNALAYLRLLQNRDDDTAFERIVNTPTRGIGEKTVETLRQQVREAGGSLWSAASRLLETRVFTSRAANALSGFITLIDTLDQARGEVPLDELVQAVLDRSGLVEYHGKESGEKGRQRVENLEELVNACKGFEPEDEEMPVLRQFLDTAALEAGEGQADDHEDSVQMMTLHSAKGLEFPVVFLAGMEENLFPHRMSMEDPGGLEEERRLCYVGITRAMQQLYLCYAEVRRMHGTESYNMASRFIREIPSSLLREVRLNAQLERPVSFGSRVNERFSVTENPSQESAFSLGQRVRHAHFGEGMIINVEGNGNRTRVQINFDSEGVKWLMLSHAPLESLQG